MSAPTAEDIGVLWRVAVRLALKRLGQKIDEHWLIPPFLLNGQRVQARVRIEIEPADPEPASTPREKEAT